jgi:class 3 adenylate cyclase/Flp pilus assembly protein TadD
LTGIGVISMNAFGYAAAATMFQEALILAERANDNRMIARTCINHSIAVLELGDYSAGIEHARRALDILTELGDLDGMAMATNRLAIAHYYSGDNARAIDMFDRAYALFHSIGKDIECAGIVGDLGNVYSSIGEYPKALEHYMKARDLLESLGDREGVALVVSNAASVYDDIGDHIRAQALHREALAIYTEINNTPGIATTTGNLGVSLGHSGDDDEAIALQSTALSMFRTLNDRTAIFLFLGNLASIHIKRNDLATAESLIAEQMTIPAENAVAIVDHHIHRGVLARRKGDFDTAGREFGEALDRSNEHRLRLQAARCHLHLRDLARDRNDLSGYVEHNEAYTAINDEIRGRNVAQQLALIDAERSMEAERREREKERAILYGTLPRSVADRMIRGEKITGDHYHEAAILFVDVVNFTVLSADLPPSQVVEMLDVLFASFDTICEERGLTKIKTIGDSYMAAAFPDDGVSGGAGVAQRAADAAIDMMSTLRRMSSHESHRSALDMSHEVLLRIGVHIGPVTAGVIGTQRLQYDVWGDTVNVASRMESHGEPGRIQVSEAFADAVKGEQAKGRKGERDIEVVLRGTIDIKGKGAMTTYWLQPYSSSSDGA